MALNLLVKAKTNINSWDRINVIVKKYIDYQFEFFPINKELTIDYDAIGVSIINNTVDKSTVEEFVKEISSLDIDIYELYSGNKLTVVNVAELFN